MRFDLVGGPPGFAASAFQTKNGHRPPTWIYLDWCSLAKERGFLLHNILFEFIMFGISADITGACGHRGAW